MRKEELIKQVAESTGIAICEVRTVIEAALKETVDAVANGRTLYIRGFGTLSPKHYKRKVARNIHKNETIQQRRDTILSQFAQAKADLETLNSDIDAEIEKNKSVISTLTSKNTELASLKSNNEGSIKTFAKFLK